MKQSDITPNVRPIAKYGEKLLARKDLEPARKEFELAAYFSRRWTELVHESVAKYGDRPQGGFVSGIYSEHFPNLIQRTLKDYATAVSEHSDKAYSLRPKGVRAETMRNLRGAIRAKYGAGYYG